MTNVKYNSNSIANDILVVLKDFFHESKSQELLEKNNLDKLYSYAFEYFAKTNPNNENFDMLIACMTKFFFINRIDPFDYISYMPTSMFFMSDVKHIDLPKNIDSIPRYAFMSSELEEITIKSNIKYIWVNAFYDCDNLRKVVIGEGVEEIGNYAFGETHDIDIYVPKSVNFISRDAFGNNYGYVVIHTENEYVKNVFNDINENEGIHIV